MGSRHPIQKAAGLVRQLLALEALPARVGLAVLGQPLGEATWAAVAAAAALFLGPQAAQVRPGPHQVALAAMAAAGLAAAWALPHLLSQDRERRELEAVAVVAVL